MAAQAARANVARVHPSSAAGSHGTVPAKYIEEEDASALVAKHTIRTHASSSLGDEDKPVFVHDTSVVDPRYLTPSFANDALLSLPLGRGALVLFTSLTANPLPLLSSLQVVVHTAMGVHDPLTLTVDSDSHTV